MNLNNKGMTLMELLISIVLIGMVLIFLFQLLTDLKNETDNNNYAYNNQVNRTEAIYNIQQDLQNYTLVGIKDVTNKTNGKLKLEFIYSAERATNKVAVLETDYTITKNENGQDVKKHYLRYTNYKGEVTSWEMKGAELDNCATFTFYKNTSSNNYYFKLNIKVYNKPLHERNYKDKNNAVDDIEITYAGNLFDLNATNSSYLTTSVVSNKQIGYCTN